jgi:hypothetical protein
MACACLPDPDAALARLAEDYIAQTYEHEPGQMPDPARTSADFAAKLDDHFAGREAQILSHPRMRLHVLASRGRRLLHSRLHRHPADRPEPRAWLGLGFGAAFAANALSRRALGGWLERVVFSDARTPLPLALEAADELRTTRAELSVANLRRAVLASCAIPYWLRAVQDIPGAPPGAYWDGGLTDYHLHWPYQGLNQGSVPHPAAGSGSALVLYPHFQPRLVPGWLDKAHTRRHRPGRGLDNLILLTPSQAWVAERLPGAKLPDREDFKTHVDDVPTRMRLWREALGESQRLADEFQAWLQAGTPLDRVQPLLA